MPVPPADPQRERPLVLHLTTADISLELLIGPQLSAFIEAGYDVHATSAPGPYVDAVRARGVTFHPLEHSTRSMSLLADLRAAVDFFRLCRELRPDIVHTHNPKPGLLGRLAGRAARVPVVVNTVHGLYPYLCLPWDHLCHLYLQHTVPYLYQSLQTNLEGPRATGHSLLPMVG